jgi:hypothetical protein
LISLAQEPAGRGSATGTNRRDGLAAQPNELTAAMMRVTVAAVEVRRCEAGGRGVRSTRRRVRATHTTAMMPQPCASLRLQRSGSAPGGGEVDSLRSRSPSRESPDSSVLGEGRGASPRRVPSRGCDRRAFPGDAAASPSLELGRYCERCAVAATPSARAVSVKE